MNSTYILALSILPGLGRKTIHKILLQNPAGIIGKDHLTVILSRKFSESAISLAIEKAELLLTKSTELGIHVLNF